MVRIYFFRKLVSWPNAAPFHISCWLLSAILRAPAYMLAPAIHVCFDQSSGGKNERDDGNSIFFYRVQWHDARLDLVWGQW